MGPHFDAIVSPKLRSRSRMAAGACEARMEGNPTPWGCPPVVEASRADVCKKTVKRVVDKSFVVRAPLEVAWNHLADVEQWPSWAKHIRSVVKSPPGPLSLHTRGTIKLANGMTSIFCMTEFVPLRHWQWVGSLLGSHVLYDHIFSQDQPGHTTVRFTVAVTDGLGVLIS